MQQLEALNVEVDVPFPSPNPLFLQPMVHLEDKGGKFTMMPIRVNNITSRQQHLQILCGVLWTWVKVMPKIVRIYESQRALRCSILGK
jgi:hypothetical protein